jgi:hypothetical protein
VHENFQSSGLKFATIKPPHAMQISLNAMEITAHTVVEQHPTPLTGDHGLSIDAEKELRDSCLDEDVERGE